MRDTNVLANCKKNSWCHRTGIEHAAERIEATPVDFKVIFAQVPLKVEYNLTDFGKSIIPVITAFGNWGDEHAAQLEELILKRFETMS